MGKTYVDTVKYVVHASFEINGIVEKPDVIGAIFGQTEGLLGDELDFRELQKNGRIGRIEVELETKGKKTIGKIMVPSSLSMVETAIIAAALETVGRVGPCEAKIKVERIEDTRASKRRYIIERAKELLKKLLHEELPDSSEIAQIVREEVKKSEIVEYGPEKLSAGPGIESAQTIILVEGRADVLNLLRHDITNVIAIEGTKIPKTIIDLSKKKETIAFLDGDRGGDLILRELLEVADIDFVARAPPGKEVEELTRKEIIKCLRNKVPVEQIEKAMKEEKEKVPNELVYMLKELRGSFKARFLDAQGNVICEMPIREIFEEAKEIRDAYALVFDGIITQRIVNLAKEKGIKFIVGIKKGQLKEVPKGLNLVAIEA